MNNNILIDCRGKNCKLEYESIAEDFKSIHSGQSIRLVTDSDPNKLYYELLAKERGNFYWALLKDGPKEWDVMIEKTYTL